LEQETRIHRDGTKLAGCDFLRCEVPARRGVTVFLDQHRDRLHLRALYTHSPPRKDENRREARIPW